MKAPKQGQSAKGTAWTSATVRAVVTGNREDEPDNALVNIIAFGSHAEKLARMAQGDSLAFTGSARPTAWQKDGELHAGMACTINEILTPYALKQRRGDQSDGRAANVAHGQHSGGANRDRGHDYGSDDFNDSPGF